MNTSIIWSLALVLATTVASIPLVGHAQTPASAARFPNIVILLADDLGYGELGCQGNPQIPTPNVDRLAADGTRCTSGYVTASFCSASRAGLLTGRYQTRFGYEFNPIGAQNEDPQAGLPVSERTLAQLLHDAGYATALIGKWHLGGTAAYHPQRRGFDEFFGFTHEGHYFVPPPYDGVTTMLRRRSLPHRQQGRWTSPDGKLILLTHMGYDEPAYDANNPIVRGSQPIAEKEHLTDALTRESLQFIERNRSRPFFLMLSYNAVHSPLQGADRYMKRFQHIKDVQRRIFAAMLSHLDDSVGAVLSKLREQKLDRRTLVFFLSDNGGPTGELTSSNRPLRGEKGDVFEGGLRIPFLVRWPGRVPAGQVFDRSVLSLDIYATAAVPVKDDHPRQKPIDGVNLLPYLSGERKTNPHPTLFWRQGRRTALRLDDWKLLRNPGRGSDGGWKLFHLGQDLGEQTDLSAREPRQLAKMKKVWQTRNDEMIDPVPLRVRANRRAGTASPKPVRKPRK